VPHKRHDRLAKAMPSVAGQHLCRSASNIKLADGWCRLHGPVLNLETRDLPEDLVTANEQVTLPKRSRRDPQVVVVEVQPALGRLRHRHRRPEKSIEALLPHFGEGEHQIDPPVPWKATPETTLHNQETCELVRRSIGELPETYRIVLLVHDIEGLATEETAKMLETSTAVIKTRLHRARQALRSLLDPHFRRGDL
jgi:RNA polymerase sigma-70 factor (ECF subfamily)